MKQGHQDPSDEPDNASAWGVQCTRPRVECSTSKGFSSGVKKRICVRPERPIVAATKRPSDLLDAQPTDVARTRPSMFSVEEPRRIWSRSPSELLEVCTRLRELPKG